MFIGNKKDKKTGKKSIFINIKDRKIFFEMVQKAYPPINMVGILILCQFLHKPTQH